ncbi:MAG: phenylalanine--tRNA ligase subunit beta, partial [Pirellulaceae bacterium]|nr:phenylalanine--tRNA ligase subunit beta [Pirellulaceae bacterium]
MIVSWDWLKQYVLLDMPVAELERRLMMAGLNHESTKEAAGDVAVDLEVTSNRPDCLGHLGVAREIAVLWDRPLTIPEARPEEKGPPVEEAVGVQIDCPRLCRRYTARVIRGVKIGPSPSWMASRLAAVGIAPINNVVDASNY